MTDVRDHVAEALRLAALLDGRGSRDPVLADTADCLRELAVRVVLLADELDLASATAKLHVDAAKADSPGQRHLLAQAMDALEDLLRAKKCGAALAALNDPERDR